MVATMNDDIREQLAALAHAQWSSWMVYLFNLSHSNGDGTITIPATLVARWQGQIATPYQELTEREKNSDREEADKVLTLIGVMDGD
jgi:hypothetical protein